MQCEEKDSSEFMNQAC